MSEDEINRAIALSYDGTKAPHISSKGEGSFAEQILAMAEKEGLYVHQDPALLQRLASLNEGESIPPALFVVIAEILSYSYLLQGKYPDQWRRPDGSQAIDTEI
ncbi:MAG: EscU/YscU/HrcU family type III secretion system export apparatus switch protein [Aeromonadaceae bacterium]